MLVAISTATNKKWGTLTTQKLGNGQYDLYDIYKNKGNIGIFLNYSQLWLHLGYTGSCLLLLLF